MIEADVILGTLTNNSTINGTIIPVMGHPPADKSDLSLDSFLKQVVANKKKGIKLDFKSIEAFKAAIKDIQALGNVSNPCQILQLASVILRSSKKYILLFFFRSSNCPSTLLCAQSLGITAGNRLSASK